MAIVPADYPDRLAARGLDVNVFGDWYGLGGSANHGALVLHHTASSAAGKSADEAAYCHHGTSDAPLYNVMVGRDGDVWLLASDKSNSSGKISTVALNEALSGRAGSVSASERNLGDDGSANDRLFAIAAQNNGVGESWGQTMCDAIAICAAVALQCLGLAHAGYVTQHRVLTARKIDNCGDACPYDWHPAITDALSGSREPERAEDDDMRACTDDDGGIYVFGPGVWQHVTGEEWGAWERFTGAPERVNNRQRDIIRTTCMSSGGATWEALLWSRIDGNPYAAGDILTSTEDAARNVSDLVDAAVGASRHGRSVEDDAGEADEHKRKRRFRRD